MSKKTKINVPVEAETQPENLAETQPRNVSEPQIENLAETRRSSVADLPPENLSETRPNNTVLSEPVNTPETKANGPADTQPNVVVNKRGRAGLWIGLLVLFLALVLGSLAGYGKGVNERISAQGTLVGKQLGAQFDLVQQDIDSGRYSVAKQRLEYIIQQEPNFPGAADKLAEVLVKSAITPSPVPTDTPTITPTADLRGQEAIFAQAQQQLSAKDWTGLMGSLDSLRKADPTYKTVIVDGMYYTALRNRGVDQLLGIGLYKTSNMEGGIYDLTLAERFGPLDGYADGLRNFSRMYIIGASFWDVNWPQAVNYFRQVNSFAPNLRDSSNVTSSQRLFQALLKYGDQMASATSKHDRCQAIDLWNEARNISALDQTYSNKYDQLYQECFPPTAVPEPPTEVPGTLPPNVPTAAPPPPTAAAPTATQATP